MNFIRNRNFRAGPQTSLEGFICPQNSDKLQKNKVFGRSEGGGNMRLYLRRKGKLPCFSYLVRGKSFSFYRGKVLLFIGKHVPCDDDLLVNMSGGLSTDFRT